MVRVLRVEIGLDVARPAGGRREGVLGGLRPSVAAVTVEIGMNAKQRKACPVMPFAHLTLVGPGTLIVAFLAAEAEIARVRIAMAVGARRAHPREDERTMAAATGSLGVGLLEGKPCALVLERWFGGDRPPSFRRVAGAAIDGQVAMWIQRRLG